MSRSRHRNHYDDEDFDNFERFERRRKNKLQKQQDHRNVGYDQIEEEDLEYANLQHQR